MGRLEEYWCRLSTLSIKTEDFQLKLSKKHDKHLQTPPSLRNSRNKSRSESCIVEIFCCLNQIVKIVIKTKMVDTARSQSRDNPVAAASKRSDWLP
jgi:hypothetical protein